ncbi:hypothetical protein [Kitasatospora sp. NPDC097643]|uniref:hypothetical protein n=1 Tax=Kitasatospora sp. NPDC097643 TaxID=3157230 RepID=UPI00332AFC18
MTLTDADALDAAVARVGEAFSGMTARPDETGCGRCFTEAEVALLRSPGVRLPAELVRQAAQKEPGHWADHPAVIRRVLPQLVVLLAEGGGAVDPEVVAYGLAAAGWEQWPGEQAASVAGFLDAWWTRTLRQAEPPTPVPEVFVSCATASSTATPWLARWEAELGRPSARRHVAETVHWWREELESDTSPFGYWWWGTPEEGRAAWAELKAWLGRRGQ